MPPFLSIVVVVYEIPREAPRTLRSLSAAYQGLPEESYEVIVVDNGSNPPFGEAAVLENGPNFRYEFIEDAPPSPVFALNRGAELARGELLGFIIDGARMASPGLLKCALLAAEGRANPIIATLPFHLGPKIQRLAVAEGYSREVEDRSLEAIDWYGQGDRLFEISSFGGSARDGWFQPIAESGCLFLRRQTFFDELKGYDDAFDLPGGGLVSLDFYRRACELDDADPVIVFGEATFHQLHQGAFTGAKREKSVGLFEELAEQYEQIRGRPYRKPDVVSDYVGHMHPSLHASIDRSLRKRRPNVDARAFAVLGMLRSGTDALLDALGGVGVEIGRLTSCVPIGDTEKQERDLVEWLHDELFRENSGSSFDPPERVEWRDSQERIRDVYIASLEAKPLWGFQDPRALWTLDGWLSALPHLCPIGIYREPRQVARLLEVHEGLPVAEGLELWRRYNERLLGLHRELAFPIIAFDEEGERFEDGFRNLCRRVDLSPPPRSERVGERVEAVGAVAALDISLPEGVARLHAALEDVKS